MPISVDRNERRNGRRHDSRYIAAGGICTPIEISEDVRISVVPRSGSTMRVFKYTSAMADVLADIQAGRLTFANFTSGDQSTFASDWWEWASGPVAYNATNPGASEPPIEAKGFSAVLAISTGAAGNLQVTT